MKHDRATKSIHTHLEYEFYIPFKMQCAAHEITMTDAVQAFVRAVSDKKQQAMAILKMAQDTRRKKRLTDELEKAALEEDADIDRLYAMIEKAKREK